MADLIQKTECHLARSFDLSFRYIDDLLSLNNPSFGDLIHRIYPHRDKDYYRHCDFSLVS